MAQSSKSHDEPKMSRFADEVGERYEETEYRPMGGKVLQRWHGSGGNVRLSHLLRSFFDCSSGI